MKDLMNTSKERHIREGSQRKIGIFIVMAMMSVFLMATSSVTHSQSCEGFADACGSGRFCNDDFDCEPGCLGDNNCGSDEFCAITSDVVGTCEPLEPPDGPGGGGGVPPGGMTRLPQGRCIEGYVQVRDLCINRNRNPATSFPFAHEACRLDVITGRVATYTDILLVDRFVADVFLFDPNGLWLGPDLVGDDQALVGNKTIDRKNDPDIFSQAGFEGVRDKNESRQFRCAYDLVPSTVLP